MKIVSSFASEKEKKPGRKKKKEEKKPDEMEQAPEEEIDPEVSEALASIFLQEPEQKPKLRTIGLFGEVSEEVSGEVIASMISLKQMGKKEEVGKNPEDPPVTTYDPMELWISTWGGSALDMFAVYDTMRMIREDCDIETIGMGKVMSAVFYYWPPGQREKEKLEKIAESCCTVSSGDILGPFIT
jgi:hypothetical protein